MTAPSKARKSCECPYCGLDRWVRQDTIEQMRWSRPLYCRCPVPERRTGDVVERRCKMGRHWVALGDFARVNGKLLHNCRQCSENASPMLPLAPGDRWGQSDPRCHVSAERVARNPLLCPLCAGMRSRVDAGETCRYPGCSTVGAA